MSDERVRHHIARLAAQLMYERQETEYFTAKRKAAKMLGIDYKYRPKDLPKNREIRDHVQILACTYEGETRTQNLKEMRLAAFRFMSRLEVYRPALIGSVLTGFTRQGSDIDIHVFSDDATSLTMLLDDWGYVYDVERKRIIKHDEERVFTHIHVLAKYEFELTVYPRSKLGYVFKSSITGKAIERATIHQLTALLQKEYPDVDLDGLAELADLGIDRYEIFRLLLQPLGAVMQSPKHHPEGDVLYHSLQVFELARDIRPWDEEFLLAALLHDIGKGIDRTDHVGAGLEALEGLITERTEFLIGRHMDAHGFQDGTMGHRAKRRLAASEHLEDLLLLREVDDQGRRRGVDVCSLEEALDFIRDLEDSDYQ
ncbi:nucleotidyltransferase domain-containing protein [bacterium AH-315-F18]|nr:nucleotidyltransferase domain-containing protein [bacterium AH-315-F18]